MSARSDTGTVVAVEAKAVGSTLMVDVAAGATTLQVDDNQPFGPGDTVLVTTVVDTGAAGGETGDETIVEITATVTVAADQATNSSSQTPGAGDTTTVRLAAALGIAATAGDTYLEVQPPEVVTTALVALDEGTGEPLPCVVPHGLQDTLRLGLRAPGTGERVTVGRDDRGVMRLLEIDGKPLVRDLSSADPTTIPDLQPAAPPAELVTVQVTGDASGLTAVASGDTLDRTTLLRWSIDGVVAQTTRSQVVRFTRDAAGQPLAPDVDYAITAQPINTAGDGTTSPPVMGRLNSELSAETVLGIVQAGFVLAGTVSVGLMTWSPPSDEGPGGLYIPLLDGGEIRFPADGSDAVITALLRARSLVVEDNLRILGRTNLIEGGVTLASGVTAPTTKARPSLTWSHAAAKLTPDTGPIDNLDIHRGLQDNGDTWIYCAALFGGSVQVMDKDTGQRFLLLHLPSNYTPFGGLVRLGDTWYLLGVDADRNNDWWVFAYNSSWQKTSEFRVFRNAEIGQAAIGTDGTSLYVAFRHATNLQLRVTEFSPVTQNSVRTDILEQSSPWPVIYGLYIGAADLGATRYVVAGTTGARVYTKSGGPTLTQQSRVAVNDWATPTAVKARGLAWDGTRFHVASERGEVWAFSRTPTAVARSYSYSYFDSDPAGLGQHETQPSGAVTYTTPPRTWTRVEVDPPNDGGGADDPDSVRIYIDNHRQPDLGPGGTVAVYDTPDATGAAGQTVNGFASLPGSVGEIVSTAADELGAASYDNGAGVWRRDPLKWQTKTWYALGSNITSGSGVRYQVTPAGIQLHVDGQLSTASGTVALLTTQPLPLKFRPASQYRTAGYFGGHPGTLTVRPDGHIEALQNTGATRGTVAGLFPPFLP